MRNYFQYFFQLLYGKESLCAGPWTGRQVSNTATRGPETGNWITALNQDSILNSRALWLPQPLSVGFSHSSRKVRSFVESQSAQHRWVRKLCGAQNVWVWVWCTAYCESCARRQLTYLFIYDREVHLKACETRTLIDAFAKLLFFRNPNFSQKGE